MKAYFTMTAIELRDAIRKRTVSAEALTRLYLNRIAKYDGKDGLNTVSELNPSAIEQAKELDTRESDRNLPLYGLPILVKDNIDVAGLHTTAGSLALSDNVAKKDAPIIANLKRNGAIILGKTNLTEFANYTTQGMPNGFSSLSGRVKNAYDSAKDPGGSSSGSAVAVSAGLCAAAIGTDTSFSVVACATDNGVVGLKPAHGALPNDGIIPIAHTLDSAGVLARDLSDAILVYSAMRDTALHPMFPTEPKKLRIAVNIHGVNQVSEAQLQKYDRLLRSLHNAGASFATIDQTFTPYQKDIMRCEFRHDLEAYLASSGASLKTLQDIVLFYESNPQAMPYGITYLKNALENASGHLDDAAYLEAMAARETMRTQILSEIKDFDACVMTGPTNIMHFVGLPSLSLAMCMASDHTPRGIILYGADETRLLSAALAMEQYCEGVTFPKL